MKKIRVLHFYKTSILESHGGVEKFIDSLCDGTSKLNIKNTVFALSKKNYNKKIKYKKYYIFNAKEDIFIFSTGFSISAFLHFNIFANKADIIHYHFPNPFADLLHLICRINKPFIITYHSDVVKQKRLFYFYKFLMNKFLSKSDLIITTSNNYLRTSTTLQRFIEKVKVIPIGIDISLYPQIKESIVEKFKQKIPTPFFLFIGALRYYKGLNDALKAVKDTNLELVIAGGGGIKNQLLQNIKKYNLKNVTFLGEISDEDKVCLLKLCYCFLFPSNKRSEAFGISLLEASAFSKPMISCEIGTGTSFINMDQKTGLVVKPNSPLEIRNAMEFMITNPKIASKMGKNAKKRFDKYFSSSKQAEEYRNIYEDIFRKHKSNI